MTGRAPSAAIREHQLRLQDELRLNMASKLFPLYLKALRRSDHALSRLRSNSTPNESNSFAWLIANSSDRPIVVTGDPGSGKTTLLESFADYRINSGHIVFLLRMGIWSPRRPLIDQITDRWLISSETREFMRSNESWVFFDALDEAPGGSDTAIEDILALFAEFPAAKVIVSCRTGQFPAWAAPRFSAAVLQPLRRDDVDTVLASAESDRHASASPEVGEALVVLRELCRNPLMLSMTQELLLAGNDHVTRAVSSGQLFNLFIELLEERERNRRQANQVIQSLLVGGINLRVLGYIAWRMVQEKRASISEEQLASWLEDMLREPRWASWWGNDRPSVNAILIALESRLPLKSSESPTDSPSRVFSFLHLTFRDVFAGRHLLYLSETSGNGVREIIQRSLEAGRRAFWPAIILLAGIEPEAGRTVRVLMELSLESRRGDLLLLALGAAAERLDTPRDDIGELVVSILDAFKNWERAFDSDLMRSGRALLPRLDPSFPQRIRDDLEYYTSKYAGLIPKEMPELSVDVLLGLLSDSSDETVTNALHSLARLQYQSADLRAIVAREVERYLRHWSGERFDQGVAALKDLGDPGSLGMLRRIAMDASAPPRARAYAATGVAALGTRDDVTVLRELLLDSQFVYRDSASWALQMLARKELVHDQAVAREIIDILMLSLRTDADCRTARYVKGNVLYSLGVLSAIEYRQQIAGFLSQVTEPFVLEDGLICLGALSDAEHANDFRDFLRHDDPGVRLKAAEALQRLQVFDEADAMTIAGDKYRIISRIGRAMLSDLARNLNSQEIRADRRLVAALLSQPPVKRTRVRTIFRGTAEEAEALLRIYESRNYPIASAPVIMGTGPVREVRMATDEIPFLLDRLRSEE